jgi:hypothetical protein
MAKNMKSISKETMARGIHIQYDNRPRKLKYKAILLLVMMILQVDGGFGKPFELFPDKVSGRVTRLQGVA